MRSSSSIADSGTVTSPRSTAALAGLSIADVVLVNPLVDGMNLVAKEAASVSGRDAAIVLSETAGAFDQMADGVLPVAPADVAGTADALAAGLAMPRAERVERRCRLPPFAERKRADTRPRYHLARRRKRWAGDVPGRYRLVGEIAGAVRVAASRAPLIRRPLAMIGTSRLSHAW
jgi:hypothetical protein